MFKDYEVILEDFESSVYDNIEKKMTDYMNKNFKKKLEEQTKQKMNIVANA